MAIEPAALHLRFRDDAAASEPLAPPDVAAFLRSSSAPAGPRPGPAEALGVVPGTGTADPDGPLVIFVQQPEFGIPAPGYDHSLPDLDSWSVRPTNFGWIAHVPPARGPGPRRAAQVLVGCLALALPTRADALAQGPAIPPPPVQAPTGQSAPAPAPAPAPSTAAPTPSPEPAPTPVVTPPVSPSPTGAAVGVQASTAVTDAAWEGVKGIDVYVELKGGKVLRGRVGAVQVDTFTLIDSSSGQILVIPKSGVASLRAHVPPPIPTQTGGGLIAGGSVLTAIGAPLFLTGVVFLGLCPSCIYIHLPMLVIGGGGIGGGIPMISKGLQRRTAFQKALYEQRLAPTVTRSTYGGWCGGLQLRF